MKGVLNKNYHKGRIKRIDYKYRLKRRTYEVVKAIEKYCENPKRILDLGTADGLMLSRIKNKYPEAECMGVEYAQELIDANEDSRIKIIQGNAQRLPFPDNQFDIVIATAIIEHVERPEKLISESCRVLKRGGVLIITTPNPFFEKIASLIGALDGDEHQITFNLKTLKKYLKAGGFETLLLKKFMISPIGFPAEILIEKMLNKFHANFTLLNQLAVGKKI